MAKKYLSFTLLIMAGVIQPGTGSPACHSRASSSAPAFTTTSSLPASCTYRPTATLYATSGCPIKCDTSQWCIADQLVVLPCGCTSAAVSPTTVTVCPTASGCVQCTTGWGIGTTTDTRCPSSATSTTAPTTAA